MIQINNSFQKNANISKVAQLLWKYPGLSRVEIARKLDLYRSTVSNIINTLINHRIVFEEKEGSALPQGGRKPICLEFNENFGCVIGIELQPSIFHAVVLNVTGTIIFSQTGAIPDSPFESIVDDILGALLPRITTETIPLLGICVGMPGIIDSGKGTVLVSDPFQLANYDFSSFLSAKYKVPVILENDANCLAWLELANNRGDNLQNFVCLNAEFHRKDSRYGERTGMGVGLGVAIGGCVYAGSKHAAGEFVSVSWRDTHNGQTGLNEEIMKNIENNPEAFTQWVVDLLTSFLPVVSVLDPEAVFVHGELARHSKEVLHIIQQNVPQFLALLKRSSCKLNFGDGSDYSVATGAAWMFFMYLFSVPGNSTGDIGTAIDWDSVFSVTDLYLK